MSWGWSPGFSKMYPPQSAKCTRCDVDYLKTTPVQKYCSACAKVAKRARDIKSDERVKARRGK
jgi:hypothetical protein